MKIHEYQAKSILKQNDIDIPQGYIVENHTQAEDILNKIGFPCVIKAQVHSGGRGKAGGVKLSHSKEDALAFIKKILNTNLITYQNPSGQPINKILIEKACKIKQELYFGMLIDREFDKVCIIMSAQGGTDIEVLAENSPDSIIKQWIDISIGVQEFHIRNLQYLLQLKPELYSSLSDCVTKLYKVFLENDLSLLEINPLIVTQEDKVMPLDAKMVFDDNALYRIKNAKLLADNSQEDSREVLAKSFNLNYITLDGNIGCLVNGAGLAMSTMDIIKHVGGSPANFLDVGGSATEKTVKEALIIILNDKNIKCILINVFGGIAKCDVIARGIVNAAKDVNIKIPIVVRLEGTNAKAGRSILQETSLNIISASSLLDAAEKSFKTIQNQE
jgi:succinyl-CoA synthetase beta subunit